MKRILILLVISLISFAGIGQKYYLFQKTMPPGVKWNGPTGSIRIELLTSEGNLIRSFERDDNDQSLDLSELRPGLYLLKIVARDWAVTERIV